MQPLLLSLIWHGSQSHFLFSDSAGGTLMETINQQ